MAPAVARFAVALNTKSAPDESLGLLVDLYNLSGALALETGDLKAAKQHFVAAADICERLATRPTLDAPIQFKLAHVTNNLGTVYERIGARHLSEWYLYRLDREKMTDFLRANKPGPSVRRARSRPRQVESTESRRPLR